MSLYKSPLALVLHKDHPCADSDKIDYVELGKETFFYTDKQIWLDHLIDTCEQLGFAPRYARKEDSVAAIMYLIECNEGITFLPRLVESSAGPHAHFINIEIEGATAEVCISWRRDDSNPSLPYFLSEFRLYYNMLKNQEDPALTGE